MRNWSRLTALSSWAAATLVGVSTLGLSSAADAWELRMEEVEGAMALATVLSSPPLKQSNLDCRLAADLRRDERHWREVEQVANLPTKSGQERELARIKEQRAYSFEKAAVDCMVLAAGYLHQINSALIVKTAYAPYIQLVPEEVTRTAGDLSAKGLRDLQALLQGQTQSRPSDSRIDALHSVFYRSLVSCWESDQLIVPGGDAKQVWRASCELLELVSPQEGEPPVYKAAPQPAPEPAPEAASAPVIQLPQRKHSPVPEYPPASRRAGEEGTVQFRVYVLADGKPGEVQILRSSGFPKLDEAVIKGVQRDWLFVPGTEDGKPVAMWSSGYGATFRVND